MQTLPTIPAALGLDGLTDFDARAGFELAAATGYRGVAFATNHRELNPDALGPSARRQVKAILAGKALRVESLRAAGPRAGLTDSATIDRTLDQVRKAISLARDMGVGTVSMHMGTLGSQPGGAALPESTIIAALRDLAQHADAAGLTLALSAGGGAAALARILKAVDFDRARINFDGAALIGAGDDVLQTAEILAGKIGQLTASDAVKSGRGVRAVTLGEGQLPLRELAQMLHEQGFHGPWVVDVRDLADAPNAAQRAAEALRATLRL
jgi:sugar phosphate isomerase/epimerase